MMEILGIKQTGCLRKTQWDDVKENITIDKDVSPNINRMQAAKITPRSDRMVPSAAA